MQKSRKFLLLLNNNDNEILMSLQYIYIYIYIYIYVIAFYSHLDQVPLIIFGVVNLIFGCISIAGFVIVYFRVCIYNILPFCS